MKICIYLFFFCLLISSAKTANVYTGIEIGGYRSNLILDSKVDVEGTGTASNTFNFNDSGANIALLLGLRKDGESYFIASEIFASKDNLLQARSQEKRFEAYSPPGPLGDYRFQVDMLKTFGVSFLGGIKHISKLKPYVSFDIIYTDFRLTATVVYPEPTVSIQQHQYLWGVAPGVGLEYAFNERFSGRLSYKINIYEKFNAKESAFDEECRSNNNFKPFVHMLKLGLIYNF